MLGHDHVDGGDRHVVQPIVEVAMEVACQQPMDNASRNNDDDDGERSLVAAAVGAEASAAASGGLVVKPCQSCCKALANCHQDPLIRVHQQAPCLSYSATHLTRAPMGAHQALGARILVPS